MPVTDRHDTGDSLRTTAVQLPRQLWRDALSVYYANTMIWRWLKSGALVFLGFFCWAAANLLLSNRPDWTWLTYPMAYGFVLVLWGPLTHLVIVPTAIRLRRTAQRPLVRTIAQQASKLNLSVFFAIVLVLGTVPMGPMVLDFQYGLGSEDSTYVDPDIECTATDEEVTCSVEAVEGIGSVAALTGDRELAVDDEPPYELKFAVDDVEEVVGQQQFTVEVRDEDGEVLRQSVRTVASARV